VHATFPEYLRTLEDLLNENKQKMNLLCSRIWSYTLDLLDARRL